jgi:hypothetical protein
MIVTRLSIHSAHINNCFQSDTNPNIDEFQVLSAKMAYFNNYEPRKSSTQGGNYRDTFYGLAGVAGFTIETATRWFESCDNFESIVLPDNLAMFFHTAKIVRAPYMLPYGEC